MAVVYLGSELSRFTGGLEALQVEAPRVIELKRSLDARFPGMGAALDEMAVALDGDIHHDSDYLPLQPTTEVHFVPRVAGG
jgi:molybdopterin converting factor small subunit